ncbi:MAG: putative bifunctional diguanylate cyclase/phosphodiesterase [Acidimicrobiales bacterium]
MAADEQGIAGAHPSIGDAHRAVARSGDPWASYTVHTVRGGLLSSVFIILVVTLHLVLPGHDHVNRAGAFTLVLVATVLTVFIGTLPWERILGRPFGRLAVYTWALFMIGMVDLGIVFTHGASSELFVLLIVTPIFLAGPGYPLSVEIGFGALTIAGYVVTLMATGWGIGVANLVFRLGMFAASSLAVGLLNHELGQSFQRQMAERKASENRAALWARVASVARQIDASDVGRVLAAVVDAIASLDFEASDICAIGESSTTYRVLRGRNVNEHYATHKHDATCGVVGLVLQRRQIVVVEDYAAMSGAIASVAADGYRTVMGAPVWVDGELAAVLEAATRHHRGLLTEEIAAFEMLATQAGHALENAQMIERQRRDADHFRQLLETAPDAVLVADASEGLIVEVSNQLEHLFGYAADELVGRPASMLMPERLRREQMSLFAGWNQHTGDAVLGSGAGHVLYVRRKDGVELPVEASFSTHESPQGTMLSVAIRDITERREFERRLAHQATHDHLTGLANRELFMQHLARSLHTRPATDPPMTVCFLDLDNFKYLNDSRGHRVGDSLVIAVAERIDHLVPGHFIARVGGDEFGLLVEGLSDHNDAVAFGNRLLSAFDQPFPVENIDCYVTASIGIAFGSVTDRPETVMSNADAAVNRAKQNGRSRFEFFDEALTAEAADRIATEAQLHLAIDRSELRLAYQPVVSLQGGQMVAMEALLRWHHPARGVVPPSQFISTAEDTGLIVPIGRWVLQTSCRQLAEWRRHYPDRPDISISVNVSNRQLEHDQFVDDVDEILRSTRLPPDLLVLEITESFFMRDFQAAVLRLQALKELGVRLAIDDFGTGFSSLFSLSRLPVDTVKIDKSFIDGLGSRYDAVVSAVVALGVAFDLDVVAEGIESSGQRDRLVELGCRYAQGFYFSKPLDPIAAESLVATGIEPQHHPRLPASTL